MPTTNNAIKFKSGLRANYDAIETKDLDTLYFCTDTMELFLGDDEYTKVTEKLTAAPTSGAAGTGTAGEHGKLYFYNSNLYLCEVTGGTTPTYTWTRVANINTKNGTVTSITITNGDGIDINATGAITSTGTRTISHAVPSGAAASTTSPNSAQTPAFNATFNIPTITTDKFGHVTGKGTTTVKIPAQTTLSKGTDTSGTATTLTFGGTFTAMTDTSVSNHTITDQNTTFTMPDISATSSGSGNVVTSITASGGIVTATKGSTAVLTTGDQTVAGKKTFSTFPVTPSSAPTTDYQAANKKYVDDKVSAGFAANDAMVFKGTIGTDGTVTALPTKSYSAGWTYRVITAGTYAGQKCEVGDMIVCVKDYATATADSDWSVIQTNIDGAVTHSANFTSGQVIVADGASGVKTTGYTIATSVPANAKFTDTTYPNMTGATSSKAGKSGLVPAPAAGKQTSFLRGDGTWVVPTNTTYTAASSVTTETVGATAVVGTSAAYARQDHVHAMPGTFGAATTDAAGTSGFVPAPAAGKQGQYLRGDGTWATPTNTDTKVTQNQVSIDGDYPVLFSSSESTNTVTGEVNKASGFTINPYTKALTATTFIGTLNGNADTATKLATARTITLTGGITSSAISFDGSTNISIPTNLGNHASNKVTTLAGYAVANTYAAITTADSLNTALGKLQLGVTQAKSAAADAKLVWGSF